uniref:uncharacterized protein LOC122579149 n=1 Tax=Erigeron canadensis TaxID=72917 RepID=UPI001CB9C3B3|nr:uncharacterized protein LOC122579149 [Erigeron canadensis]
MSVGLDVGIGRVEISRQKITAASKVKGDGQRRAGVLKMVDRQLSKGNFKMALSLLKQLHLSAFSSCSSSSKQVPKRVSSVEELNLSMTETSTLQPLFDSILGSIKSSLESSPLDETLTGEDGNLYLEDDDIIDNKQVVQHEAGHFLVGYLLGILPKEYSFSSLEDVKQDKVAVASVKFIGFEFLAELEDKVQLKKKSHEAKPGHRANKNKLSSTVLCKFACVIVGGLVAEHLVFGYSKGHHADVEKLDRVLKWMHFTEDEANTLMRWAVLNTLLILNRHDEARSTLVEAMVDGRSIGKCIDMIESTINDHKI